MPGLTPKQEKFCQAYIETGNASEAYRQAYDAENMSEPSINKEAAILLCDPKITPRVDELKGQHQKRHNVTVDSLIEELEEARKVADADRKAAAMVSATMGKARILGLDKQVIEQTKPEITLNITRPNGD